MSRRSRPICSELMRGVSFEPSISVQLTAISSMGHLKDSAMKRSSTSKALREEERILGFHRISSRLPNSPSLHMHNAEYTPRSRSRHQFEPALRVFDRLDSEEPHEQVEAVHEDRSEQTSGGGRLLLEMSTRSYRYGFFLPVAFAHFVKTRFEFVEVGKLCCPIGIGEEEISPTTPLHSLQRGVSHISHPITGFASLTSLTAPPFPRFSTRSRTRSFSAVYFLQYFIAV